MESLASKSFIRRAMIGVFFTSFGPKDRYQKLGKEKVPTPVKSPDDPSLRAKSESCECDQSCLCRELNIGSLEYGTSTD